VLQIVILLSDKFGILQMCSGGSNKDHSRVHLFINTSSNFTLHVKVFD